MAREWWEKAATQGFARAQQSLGMLYNVGDGVSRDYVCAYMWYDLAAAGGDKAGAKLRDEIAEQMTPFQIRKAKKMAQEWKPKGK